MNYNTNKRTNTIARTLLILLLTVIIIAGVCWALETAEAARVRWEPDCEFPMANAHISWEQTFYQGGDAK